jgi:hypothetical protein
MRIWINVATSLACLVLACGGSGSTSAGPGSDAGADAAGDSNDARATGNDGGGEDDATGADGSAVTDATSESGAGTFVCGNTVCDQTEVCVHQACGCVLAMPRDAGTCLPGSDANSCSASCPPPYCWSPDAGTTLVCDKTDGGLSGVFNSLPQGTDLVCYSSCT